MPEQTQAAAARASDGAAGGDPAFDRLHELLLGREARALAAAEERIAELELAQRALPERLPQALRTLQEGAARERLGEVLAAPVAQALGSAVRNQRQGLVDALFPVIGPLIRRSIAEALRNLVADLNDAIESSLTLRGLRWRVEAWRAGVPYAQVVLRHRLACRIDHVFLIERESGRLLWRASASELAELDADAVAGMLTALGDFVSDSVGGASGGGLESATVGEHLVWVVPGPLANLACFMRGTPPPHLRERLQLALEEIHVALPGERETAAAAATHLDPDVLLPTHEVVRRGSRPLLWPWLLLGLLALVIAASWALRVQQWRGQVAQLAERVRAEPGFVLEGIDSRPWRSLVVRGLRDPDAVAPEALAQGARLGGVVPRFVLAGYLSSEDALVERRARRLLAPPGTVRLAVRGGVLELDGLAEPAWIEMARARAGWVPGVGGVEVHLSPLADAAAARAELERMLAALADLQVPFGDEDEPGEGAMEVVAQVAEALSHAQALASRAGVALRIESVGRNDETGGDAVNARVRALRARWLAAALATRGFGGVEPVDLDSRGRRSAWLRIRIEGAP